MKLASADERVVIPRPAVFLEQLADVRIIELEARLAKVSMLVDARPGALQITARLDRSVLDEIGGLGEYPQAQTSRTAKFSERTSLPHLTRHLRSAASRTDTHG